MVFLPIGILCILALGVVVGWVAGNEAGAKRMKSIMAKHSIEYERDIKRLVDEQDRLYKLRDALRSENANLGLKLMNHKANADHLYDWLEDVARLMLDARKRDIKPSEHP